MRKHEISEPAHPLLGILLLSPIGYFLFLCLSGNPTWLRIIIVSGFFFLAYLQITDSQSKKK